MHVVRVMRRLLLPVTVKVKTSNENNAVNNSFDEISVVSGTIRLLGEHFNWPCRTDSDY